MKFELFKNAAKTVNVGWQRKKLLAKKHSPELLLGAGIAGFVITVVEASRSTLKARDILERYDQEMTEAKEALKVAKEKGYDDFDMGREKLIIYSRTFVDIARIYAPSIALGSLSLACIITSRNIMNRRYLAAVSAYNAVSEAFHVYRDRVREEMGEVYDRHYMYGTDLDTVTTETIDENGKKKKTKEVVELPGTIKSEGLGDVWFDEFLPDGTKNYNWDANPDFCEAFLRGRNQICNDILHTRGHLFLNEVYDELGLPHTTEGQLIGWVMGNGNNYVDFGIWNDHNLNVKPVGNHGKAYLLTFNIDPGMIYDKI